MAGRINKNAENIENVELTDAAEIIEDTVTATKKYKTEKCKVLLYNEKTKELDINFKGYGIRLNNVDKIDSDFVLLKYHGEIGKPNFSFKL